MYFSHARCVQAAAAPLGVVVSTQHADFSLRLVGADHAETWRAKFVSRIGSRLMYTDQFLDQTVGFAGWMPHALRQWPIATDKSEFKRHAIACGIPTPAACFDPARIGGPFIIKQAHSSFGEGIRGPFVRYDPADAEQQLGEAEYYENFILGNIAKAWCWGGECVALQLDRPSTVVGDGRATLRELVEAKRNARVDHDWTLIGALARYCGIASVDDVPAAGKEILVEFRYGSRYDQAERHNTNALPRYRDTDLGAQLARASEAFARAISPDRTLTQSLYTLDAIVDASGQAWFLEMNCNPLVHPDAYEAILRERFGGEGGEGQRDQALVAA